MLRAVLDTNVLLSGLLRGRGTRPLLLALIDGRFEAVVSHALLTELTDVISRPAWRDALDAVDVRDLLMILREAATFVTPTEHLAVCRDPRDNAFLDAALAGHADCLVTGDNDLLILHPFRHIAILRPADFLRRLPA